MISKAFNIRFYRHTSIDNIIIALEQGLELHAIYTDLGKVFDTVDQNIHINTLFKYGLSGKRALDWIAPYLVDRFFSSENKWD